MITPGTVLDDKYQVWEKIGAGGMGTVYKAQHLTLDRPVAIKFLHPEYSSHEKHKARFVREAKVSSRLIHDHAITIHDFGVSDEHMYIVMELLTGKPLHRIVGRGKPLDVDRACTIAWQVADVLVAAHELSLVHRDLKPENIMVETRADGTDRAIVVDFGLAFLAETDQESLARLTQEGVVAGTPAFISPEQARGLPLTTKSDIYSFGCVLYEMFTGFTVFMGNEAIKLLNQHLFVPPVSPRDAYPDANVPVAVDAIIMDMLAKDAEDRPTATQVRNWFAQVLGNETPRERGRPDALLSPRKDRSVTQSPVREDAKTALLPTESKGQAPTGGTIGIVTEDLDPNWIVSLASANFYLEMIETNVEGYRVVIADRVDSDAITRLAEKGLVIAISENSEIDTVTGLMKAGAFDVIAFPFELSDLVKKVERAWRKRKRS